MGESITSGQKDQLLAMVMSVTGGVIDSMARDGTLTKQGAEQVRRSGDEFKNPVGNAVREALVRLSVAQDFANEEALSTVGYFSGYRQPRSVTEQANRLREIFPGIGYANESLASLPVLNGAEGKFVIPPWQKVAMTYGVAMQIVLDKLRVAYGDRFVNYIVGKLDTEYLRESLNKRVAFRRLVEKQRGFDLLVVDAQFGIRHRGRSVQKARAVMGTHEFCMGAFEVAIMLLTHPERLCHYEDLWINCPGDEYSWNADGQFEDALFFEFNEGNPKLDALGVDYVSAYCGSASGFLLQ